MVSRSTGYMASHRRAAKHIVQRKNTQSVTKCSKLTPLKLRAEITSLRADIELTSKLVCYRFARKDKLGRLIEVLHTSCLLKSVNAGKKLKHSWHGLPVKSAVLWDQQSFALEDVVLSLVSGSTQVWKCFSKYDI